jgi:hypothetical protein
MKIVSHKNSSGPLARHQAAQYRAAGVPARKQRCDAGLKRTHYTANRARYKKYS